MELLQSIEQLGAVQLLKSSFIAYPVVNALHIAAIGALLTGVVLMDLAVLGWISSLPREKFIALLRRVVFVAFFVAVQINASCRTGNRAHDRHDRHLPGRRQRIAHHAESRTHHA